MHFEPVFKPTICRDGADKTLCGLRHVLLQLDLTYSFLDKGVGFIHSFHKKNWSHQETCVKPDSYL